MTNGEADASSNGDRGETKVLRLRVGGMPEEVFQSQQKLVADVTAVAAGDRNERDMEGDNFGERVDVVGEMSRDSLSAVWEMVQGFARKIIVENATFRSEVESALSRAAKDLNLADDELKPEFTRLVYEEVINRRLTEIRLAFEETMVDHLLHGNKDPRKVLDIEVYFDEATGMLVVESQDEGPGYDTTKVVDMDALIAAESETGRGKFLTDVYADAVEYPDVAGNRKGSRTRLQFMLVGFAAAKPRRDDKFIGSRLDQMVVSGVNDVRHKIKQA